MDFTLAPVLGVNPMEMDDVPFLWQERARYFMEAEAKKQTGPKHVKLA